MRKLYQSFLFAAVLASSTALGEPESAPVVSSDEQIDTAFANLDDNKDGAIDANEAKGDENLAADFDSITETGKVNKTQFVTWFKEYYGE